MISASLSASQLARYLLPGTTHHPHFTLGLPSIQIKTFIFQSRHRSIQVRKRILDKKIPHQYVRIRDESTREVGPLTPLSTVLSNINKVDERVELILSEPEPIVRVISKEKLKELHKQDKAAVKPKRTYPPKEIQITWSIEREDLERKLDKVKKELDRNVTVELVIGRKKGMPIPSPGEKMEKMDVIAEMLKLFGREDVGARSIGSQLSTMYFRPPPGKKP